MKLFLFTLLFTLVLLDAVFAAPGPSPVRLRAFASPQPWSKVIERLMMLISTHVLMFLHIVFEISVPVSSLRKKQIFFGTWYKSRPLFSSILASSREFKLYGSTHLSELDNLCLFSCYRHPSPVSIHLTGSLPLHTQDSFKRFGSPAFISFIGGSGLDSVDSATFDSSNNLWILGSTTTFDGVALNNPTDPSNGAAGTGGFVMKFSPQWQRQVRAQNYSIFNLFLAYD